MMVRLNVKAEYNQAAKLFPEIAKRLPALAAQAINATATEARRTALRRTAAELRLPQNIVQRRMTRYGAAKNARTWLSVRASAWKLWAELAVYTRGIPFFQIAGAQTKAGVKGKGGRLERGAFKVRSGKYEGIVFRRIAPKPGGTRAHLAMPRVSVRPALLRHFSALITGPDGIAMFRRHYRVRIQRELAKAGVRA